ARGGQAALRPGRRRRRPLPGRGRAALDPAHARRRRARAARDDGPRPPRGRGRPAHGRAPGATVRADEPSVVYRLTLDDLARLRRDDPRAASGVYEWLARRMAGRIGLLVTTVDALRR